MGYAVKCALRTGTPIQSRIPISSRLLVGLMKQSVSGIRPAVRSVLTLWVQPSKEVDLSEIDAICAASGFKQWRNDQLLSIHMLEHAVKSKVISCFLRGVWVLEVQQRILGRKHYPPQVAAVVRQIQRLDPHTRTISMTITRETAGEMQKTVTEVEAETEKNCREAIRNGCATFTDYYRLADALYHRGELTEAEQYARAAVAANDDSPEAWTSLAKILFKRENFAGARDALERGVRLNPNSSLMLIMLSACWVKLGDPVRSRELHLRANSLSGGQFQG